MVPNTEKDHLMELPKRKKIRLENFNYSNGGSYFLTICTKDREKILSRIEPAEDGEYSYNEDGKYLRVVLTNDGKIAEKYILSGENMGGIRVDEYVIMPDHIHMVVFVENDEWEEKNSRERNERIPGFVSALKRLCHREMGKTVFQRSYHDHVIRNHEDYEQIIRYIHRNPAKWYFYEHYGKEEQ